MTTMSYGPKTLRRPYLTLDPDPDTVPVFLNMREIRRRTGLGEMTIRRQIELGQFPRAVRLARHRVAWRKADFDAWAASRAEVV